MIDQDFTFANTRAGRRAQAGDLGISQRAAEDLFQHHNLKGKALKDWSNETLGFVREHCPGSELALWSREVTIQRVRDAARGGPLEPLVEHIEKLEEDARNFDPVDLKFVFTEPPLDVVVEGTQAGRTSCAEPNINNPPRIQTDSVTLYVGSEALSLHDVEEYVRCIQVLGGLDAARSLQEACNFWRSCCREKEAALKALQPEGGERLPAGLSLYLCKADTLPGGFRYGHVFSPDASISINHDENGVPVPAAQVIEPDATVAKLTLERNIALDETKNLQHLLEVHDKALRDELARKEAECQGWLAERWAWREYALATTASRSAWRFHAHALYLCLVGALAIIGPWFLPLFSLGIPVVLWGLRRQDKNHKQPPPCGSPHFNATEES